jgi:peptide chain release factor 2
LKDFSEELGDVARRVGDARSYLKVDDARVRLAELEKQASEPGLWDDAERARSVTSDLARVRDDIEIVDDLDQRISDVETLYELAREESDESLEPEIADGIGKLAADLDRLELRALFSG